MVGFAKQTVGKKFNEEALKTLYVAFVRSKIDYCSIVWFPVYRAQISELEKIQKKFTMLAQREWPNEANNYEIRPYETRCMDLKIETLERRFLINGCQFVFDILEGILEFSYIKEKLIINRNRQTRHTSFISIPMFTCNFFCDQPLWRVVRQFIRKAQVEKIL